MSSDFTLWFVTVKALHAEKTCLDIIYWPVDAKEMENQYEIYTYFLFFLILKFSAIRFFGCFHLFRYLLPLFIEHC